MVWSYKLVGLLKAAHKERSSMMMAAENKPILKKPGTTSGFQSSSLGPPPEKPLPKAPGAGQTSPYYDLADSSWTNELRDSGVSEAKTTNMVFWDGGHSSSHPSCYQGAREPLPSFPAWNGTGSGYPGGLSPPIPTRSSSRRPIQGQRRLVSAPPVPIHRSHSLDLDYYLGELS